MKTNELIKRLQQADPSGELECCVGNIDIYFIETLPAYYDGALQVLVHDEKLKDKAWSIVGAKIKRSGEKVQIHTVSIEDAIYDMVDSKRDFPVEVEDGSSGYNQQLVDKWKSEARKLNKDYEQVNNTNQ